METINRMGSVALRVRDLQKVANFYQGILGMHEIADPLVDRLVLGADNIPLIQLIHRPESQLSPRSPGLFHSAILLPSRKALARLVYQLVERGYPIQGTADHGVSEAVYTTDPEGNGLEFYRDLDQADWPRDEAGKLEMVTDPLNLDRLMFELKGQLTDWEGLPSETRIGHVHLQVNDLGAAKIFYQEVLRFDLQQEYGLQAAFFSLDGYHHHVGANTWNSRGSSRRGSRESGLEFFEFFLQQAEFKTLIARLGNKDWKYEEINGGISLFDPSGNEVHILVR